MPFKNIKKHTRFVDLCSGIGGFHLGLAKSNMICVFASEKDKIARVVYERNFRNRAPFLFENNLFNNDIFNINPIELPDFDICCSGFPCQPFSQIGKKRGFKDEIEQRGNVFDKILEIIEVKKPSAYFLENVQHIVKHDDGNTFKYIESKLRKAGYSFYFKVIKASDFGLPQYRPRTFMVGFRDEDINEQYFKFPKPIKLKMSMSDVFGGNCTRDIGLTLRQGGAGSPSGDRRNWDGYIVDGKLVRLDAKHGKIMQGFPDNFYLPDSRSKAMRLLGNSVAVNVVFNIGKQIQKYLLHKESFKDENRQLAFI